MESEKWYILRSDEGREKEGEALIRRVIPNCLYTSLSVPTRVWPIKRKGVYHPVETVMFPGYVLIETTCAKELHKELRKSREFPQFLIFGKDERKKEELVPISIQDLSFLQDICGKQLQFPMGITDVILGEDKRIVRASGILENYINHIVKLNLHKRYAVARVSLFNRSQEIFFGIRLSQDEYCAV